MGGDRLPGEIAAQVDRLRAHPRVLRLRCGVQHYTWGDPDAIPRLLGLDNPAREPFAELWIGAHPDLSAEVELEGGVRLDRLIEAAPAALLGPEIARRFDNRLPFLLKILAAAQPLSIQVHPDKRQAEVGFRRENRLGVPVGDPRRNYHDPNHKPELLCALTPFYALRGFRPLDEIQRILAGTPEFQALCPGYEPTPEGLAAWYRRVMKADQEELDRALDPLVRRLRRRGASRPFAKTDPEYWVLRADELFSTGGHRDRGLLSIFVLNLLRLDPGQAIFLPAGELHAYLEGTGVEVMANSNNVLRGGLTPKHVDVDELLKVVRFRGANPEVIAPAGPPDGFGRSCYCTPAGEFELCRVLLGPRHEEKGNARATELAIVIGGRVTIATRGHESSGFDSGQCYLVPHELRYRLRAEDHAEVYMATVPHS